MSVNTVVPPISKWVAWLFDIYGSGKPPVLGTVDIQEIEDKARDALKDNPSAFLYVLKGAGTSSTCAENRRALDRWKLVPRMLNDVGERNLEITIFGVTHPAPIFVAPIGAQGLMHNDGELATARAAAKVGVPLIVSSVASRSMEDVAQAHGPNGHRWYQLYWTHSVEITQSLLKRAKANGYTALVLTVDTMVIGWRPHDHGIPYSPAGHGFGVQQGISDPVFMGRFGLEPRHERPPFPYTQESIRNRAAAGDPAAQQAMLLGKGWVGEIASGIFRSWDEIQFIKDNWDGPIILKGILAVEDAEKAIVLGIDGIIVSNHGGRQVDGSIGALDALDIVMQSQKVLEAQSSGKLTVLFDSGIRTGSDILKALALGAQGVLIGRPFMYGLAIAGEAGVEQILMQTIADLHITMGLCGFRDVKDVVGGREKLMVKMSQ
ncbi:(S)-2-hydroxy-acid oxidase [Paxillus involutus ATCC 200175]|uniref:(S)-2-hydroxy-acid oxidase n=1 Tax=Paxillus involutus ATCC 200175 TaxID=664439 RepID=A0A0C9TJP0_PAXIN|nr:(S)-2-hydroxy-acid oxidase [Paxillus involutus ATCC 200175]